jgi:hypothetical protein
MTDSMEATASIRSQAAAGLFRVSEHAQQEMVAEGIALDDVLHAIADGAIIEDYPTHRRGACCLVSGHDAVARPIHVVCTTATPVLIIITVYLPRLPRWLSPTQRSPKP